MKIGIEVELHSDNFTADSITKSEGLNFNDFTFLKGMTIGVKLSREYYSSTIEYNFTPFDNNLKSFKEIKKFLDTQIKKYNLKLHSAGPSYVGTHIHIFDEDKVNIRIDPLIRGVAKFMSDNMDFIKQEGAVRLLFAHQLWGNYSWNNSHIWKRFLIENCLSPSIYDNTRSKPKYRPVIYSKANSNTGKPKSLEIRIIPNEFIFNFKAFELMSLIEKKEILNKKINIVDFYSVLLKKIFPERVILNDNNYENIRLQSSYQGSYLFNGKIYTKEKITHMLDLYKSNTINIRNVINVEGINNINYKEFSLLLEWFEMNFLISLAQKNTINRILVDLERVFLLSQG